MRCSPRNPRGTECQREPRAAPSRPFPSAGLGKAPTGSVLSLGAEFLGYTRSSRSDYPTPHQRLGLAWIRQQFRGLWVRCHRDGVRPQYLLLPPLGGSGWMGPCPPWGPAPSQTCPRRGPAPPRLSPALSNPLPQNLAETVQTQQTCPGNHR